MKMIFFWISCNTYRVRVYDISDDDSATDDEERDSNSVKFGKSLINAIVIICVIALFTFVLVFCYYMKCMKVNALIFCGQFFITLLLFSSFWVI